MDLKEVASLLGLSRDMAKVAIEEGIATRNGNHVRLAAIAMPGGPDVTETELDAFIAAFEHDDPGRHPPVAVRRDLLIECGYKCAVCRGDAPLDFHHIVNWSKVRHHDADHMLAACANCHAKITRHGQPDEMAQKEIKRRLRSVTKGATRARTGEAQRKTRNGVPSSWGEARERAGNIANALLQDALVAAAEAGEEQDFEQASVQLAGCYEALRIHWLREYRLANRSDAPRLEGYLPAILSPAAHAVFPDRPWLSHEPKLSVDKHAASAQRETPFSVSDRRAFAQMLDSIDPLKEPGATPPLVERELLRLAGRLVDCIRKLEEAEAPILERFGEAPPSGLQREIAEPDNDEVTEPLSPGEQVALHDAIKEAKLRSEQAVSAKKQAASRLTDLLTKSVEPIREAVRIHAEKLLKDEGLKIRMLPVTLGGWTAIGRALADGDALKVLHYECKEPGIGGFQFYLQCGVSYAADGEPTVNVLLRCVPKGGAWRDVSYLLRANGEWTLIRQGVVDGAHVVDVVRTWLADAQLWAQPE